ncbi:MAG: hypothetical protein WDO56_05945 [Gammaproteobacteria bacterium]
MSNEHILANESAFDAAVERARAAFSGLDGVVSVSWGLKQAAGNFSDDFSIVVLVRQKKRNEELAPAERIPREFEGYPTDVRVSPSLRPGHGVCDNFHEYSEIKGGIQICTKPLPVPGDAALGPGTLTCVVRKRNDLTRDNVYLLSNRHVMHTKVHGLGDVIHHPWPPNLGKEYLSTPLGPVVANGTYGNTPYAAPGMPVRDVFIDCAIARLDIDSLCCDSTCTKDNRPYRETIIDVSGDNSESPIADVRNVIDDKNIVGQLVTKVGRTTGRTKGRVVHIDHDAIVGGDQAIAGSKSFFARRFIEIAFEPVAPNELKNCHGKQWFADLGDSGAAVLDENNRIIGIISQVPTKAAADNATCMACHIVPCLDTLNICIPTVPAGTSHGSTWATDGSGLKPAAPSAAQSRLPDGKLGFTALPAEIPPSSAAPPVQVIPVHVTDDEAHHMRELLAAFRATRLGPQLHALFADLRRELGYLVRNSRPVKVAWARNKGPAFLAHVLNHLSGHTDSVPHEVQGVSRYTLLVRMREVLSAHGSNAMRETLARHGDELLAMLTNEACHSVADCLAWLRKREVA